MTACCCPGRDCWAAQAREAGQHQGLDRRYGERWAAGVEGGAEAPGGLEVQLRGPAGHPPREGSKAHGEQPRQVRPCHARQGAAQEAA